MTVNTENIYSGPYTGNDISDTFSYGFRIQDESQLNVYQTDDEGNRELLTLTTDYTVTGVDNDLGGTITLVAGALSLDYEIFIEANYPATQDTAFASQGRFNPKIHEDALDKLTFLIKQLQYALTNTVQFAPGYTGASPVLPDPEAGDLIRWTEDGIEGLTIGEILSEASAIISQLDMNGNQIKDLAAATEAGDAINLTQATQLLAQAGVDGVIPNVFPTQTGDGVTEIFSTPVGVGAVENSFLIHIGTEYQRPGVDFTVDAGTGDVTFTAAPPDQSKIYITYFNPVAIENPDNALITATGTTTPRSLADRFADTFNVKDNGALPYPFDSTNAIDVTMAKAAAARGYVDLDNLALKYVGSLNIPDGVKGIIGGSKTICWFGTLDDKRFLKDGEQHNLTGSILFSGTFDTFNTTRSDQFSSFTYMVKQSSRLDLVDVAFLQDMIVLDSNDDFTTPGNEGYSPCDVGFLIDDVGQNTYTNKCVWGYFDKAGTVIYSKSGNDDPDYNIFHGGSTYGKIGFAEIAADVGSPYGLSGTTCFGYKMGSLDHHSRNATDAPTLYANADTWRCLYIDGDVEPASTAEINGHYFTNCVIRTRSDTMIEYDHASNVVISGGVIESAKYGITNSTETKFKASSNTKKGIQFLGVRLNNSASIFNEDFAGVIPYSITVTGDPVAGAYVSSAPDNGVVGGYSFSMIGTDRFTGDPFVVFGKNINNSNSGWRITRDLSDGDKLEFRWDGVEVASLDTTGGLIVSKASADVFIQGDQSTINIVSGEITITNGFHAVDTEGDIASDDVDTIVGGESGQRLVLRALSQARTVILRNGTGNLNLEGDCTLDNSTDTIELIYSGSSWLELSRSNNGA